MPRLPSVSAREVVRALEKAGFSLERQVGSHLILRNAELRQTISVPNHDPVKPGTLRSLLRSVGLSPEELSELLRR